MKTCTLLGAAIVAAAAGSASAGFISTVNDADPIHHWRLGDGARSTTAADSVGGAHGTYAGTPNHVPGVLGGSNTAAAMPSYVAAPHDGSMQLRSGTYMFWMKETGRMGSYGLLSKDSWGYDSGGHMTMRTTGDGEVQVRLQSTRGSYWVESDEVLRSNTWHSIAFSFGERGMRLYVDGVLEDTDRYTGGMEGNHEPLVIGANSWGSGDRSVGPVSQLFSGLMDEVMIFDHQLTGDEIGGIHRAAMVPAPGTIALAGLGASCFIRRRRNR